MGDGNPAKTVITKKIIILMPFEGELPPDQEPVPGERREGSPFLERFYNLMFRRFKYIIERRVRRVEHRGAEFAFSVNVFLTRIGPIPRDALQAIRDSDIVIAYINAHNSTVIYELAARTMLRAEWVVIVDHTIDERLKLLAPRDWSRLIPFYLRQFGHTELSKDNSGKVFEEIINLASSPERIGLVPFDSGQILNEPFDSRDFDSPKIPFSIKKMIDGTDDSYLERELQRSFKELIEQPRGKPDYIRGIMEEFDPEFMVSNGTTSTYYPSVVMKYSFYPRDENDDRDYEESDLVGEPIACDWNSKFLDLFGFAGYDRTKPLTDTVMEKRLRRFMADEDFAAFEADQGELTKRIIFGNDIGLAEVPIRMKVPGRKADGSRDGGHPDPSFWGKCFRPGVILKKPVGRRTSIHYLYTLVIFFQIGNSASGDLYKYDL